MSTAIDLMTCDDDIGKFLKRYTANQIIAGCKLDGVRCAAYVDAVERTVHYYSRNGKQFRNFDCFNEDLLKLADAMDAAFIVYDGEVISEDKKFQKLMMQVHRKYNVDNGKLQFMIFDCFNMTPYSMATSLYGRLRYLCNGFAKLKGSSRQIFATNGKIALLTQALLYDFMKVYGLTTTPQPTHVSIVTIHELRDAVIAKGYEGLVLKSAYGTYEHKRSSQWCKVKEFHTLDLPVVDWYVGVGKHEGRLGALVVEYKGKRVNVGSGFTDQEREEFAFRDTSGAWRTALPGIIEVSYQEETSGGKLRFPTFIKVRDDKNEVDGKVAA